MIFVTDLFLLMKQAYNLYTYELYGFIRVFLNLGVF
jgi:hypothetical protein